MAESITDNPFIVISGHNPQAGKRERISRVRAHITKRHFHKLRNGGEAKQRRRPASPDQNRQCQNAGNTQIAKELRNSVPVTSHPLLDPAFFAAETTRRMHKCEPPLSLLEQQITSQIGNCLIQIFTFASCARDRSSDVKLFHIGRCSPVGPRVCNKSSTD